jgi:cytochrome P450
LDSGVSSGSGQAALENFKLLDPCLIENPYPFYHALLEQAPVYQVPGTPVYLVSSWQLIEEVLRNQADYSANLTGILITGEDGSPELFDLSAFGGSVDAIANADEPRHSIHRKLVLPQLNARKIEVMAPELRRWTQQRIQSLVDRGAGDWIAEVANPVPMLAMARLIGLPLGDLPQFLSWAFSGGEILAGTTSLHKMSELAAATAAMSDYLRTHFCQALAAEHRPHALDITEELVNGVRANIISEGEAISILIVLVGAAGESTAGLVGSAVRILAQDKALQQTLRESPGLIPNFVEEVVRLESPFRGHYRAVLHPTKLGGVLLPENSRVLLMWAAANRDPAVFTDPDTLDLARGKPREHLAFGQGIHFCVGARLARMETKIMLEELLQRSNSFCIAANAAPEHLQSIFVRRLHCLSLSLRSNAT